MLKANIKSAFFITILSTLILLVGCSSPEEKKASQIEDALSLSEKGSTAEALEILEGLAEQYPNDVEILKSIAAIYSDQGDATMAAFFVEQAYLQSPDDTELLFQTYKTLEAANQPASHLLEKLATDVPGAMTSDLWIRLGQYRQADNKIQPALDAYLKGVDPDKEKPAPETAAAIGQLFAKAGNLAQAETWLEMAADNDDPNALTALFGLLELNLRQKDWAGAEATVAQLDKQFPGAIAASQWQQAREELVRWRKAQDEMKAQLAKDEAAKKAAAAKAAAAKKTDSSEEKPATGSGKAQVIADMEAAEAMANAPAVEIEVTETEADVVVIEDTVEVTETTPTPETSGKTITFDPSIAIQPADPEFTFEVDYDEASITEDTTYTVETTEDTTAIDTTEAETLNTIESAQQAAPVRAEDRPRSIEELLADAETATLDRDYKSAIRKYWAVISKDNSRSEVWNLLSRAYLVDGQLNNAETSALEAVRLAPSEVAYTLDYLRVAQRSKGPDEFLSELETAYDRFPSSPEITLSLARAHERISKQNNVARNLYLRFVDIAPNHPLVPEARAAAARL